MTPQRDVRYGHYLMILEWDPRDAIYVVTVPELPGCRTHGGSRDEAVTNARQALELWLDSAREWGDPIPPPKSFKDLPAEAAVEEAVGSR